MELSGDLIRGQVDIFLVTETKLPHAGSTEYSWGWATPLHMPRGRKLHT